MKLFAGFLLVGCCLASGNFFASPLTQGQKDQGNDATVVQRGQVTEKEHIYSNEYRKMYPRRGRTFTELINRSIRAGKTTEEIGILVLEPEIPDDPDAPKVTPTQFMEKQSCNSDAIVVGTVQDKKSHMTDDEKDIYTAYTLIVSKVLKNNLKLTIQVEDVIEVTRPGGIIKLDGRRIKAEDRTYPFLQKEKSYLLFLRFIPSISGYIVAGPDSDYRREDDGSFTPLFSTYLPYEVRHGKNLSTLLTDQRILSGEQCSEEGR
ncbi:MAG TPA: hypothetical protein DEA22_04820 [Blastocatellia bacterium]|nr:hypothetical protein [Blastocatellia bacterium]